MGNHNRASFYMKKSNSYVFLCQMGQFREQKVCIFTFFTRISLGHNIREKAEMSEIIILCLDFTGFTEYL